MIALIQRVTMANVSVDDQVIGSIDGGLLVLLAIEPDDNLIKAERMAQRVIGYRVFNDDNHKMNLNVKQVAGEILVISQFTLAANTQCGMRPSFTTAAEPKMSKALYKHFTEQLRLQGFLAPTGEFGADMQVQSINDGPVTFTLTV